MPKYVPDSWVAIWKSRSWEVRTKAIEAEGAIQGVLVCKLTKLGFGNSKTAVNANLIAAAPDLLDACQSLVAAFEYYGNGGVDADTVTQIRTAIAKAEGRQ